MGLFIVLAGIVIAIASNVYALRQKRRLADEAVLEMEKAIKPKIVWLFMLPVLPVLALSCILMMAANHLTFSVALMLEIATVVIGALCFIFIQKIIGRSDHKHAFGYVSSYFLLRTVSLIVMLTGLIKYLADNHVLG